MKLRIIHGQLDPLHDRSLSLRTDLLSTLECNQRDLEVMRRFLKCRLLMGLEKTNMK